MPPVSNATINLTRFLDERIAALKSRKSFAKIAHEAHVKEITLGNLTSGRTRLPLDKVADIAIALEVDPTDLMPLALAQFMSNSLLELVLETGARHHGVQVAASDDFDPAAVNFMGALHELKSIMTNAKFSSENILADISLLETRVSGVNRDHIIDEQDTTG